MLLRSIVAPLAAAASFLSVANARADFVQIEAPTNSSFTNPLSVTGSGQLGQFNGTWVPGDVNSAISVFLHNNTTTITNPAQIQFGSSAVNGFTVFFADGNPLSPNYGVPVAYANMNATFNTVSLNDPLFASLTTAPIQSLLLVFTTPGSFLRNSSNLAFDGLSGGGLFAPSNPGAINNIIVGSSGATNTIRNFTVNFVNTDEQSFNPAVIPTPSAAIMGGVTLALLAAGRARRARSNQD
jgi:hypothetical protein